MNIQKPILVAGIASVVGATGLIAGSSFASAEASKTNHDSLASKIAQKFNLKEADVQAVFDENKAEHQKQQHQNVEDKLNQLVKDGKLSAEQKDKILAKAKELQSQREQEKSKSKEERKKDMSTKRADLEKWATDNNIPTEYLKFLHPHKGGRH